MMSLAKLLLDAKSTVVFSGAGMSTESGLQDFRSADRGMWNNRNPVELADIEAMNERTDDFVKFYRWRIEEMLNHEPNQGHRILANWEHNGMIKGIITQNVENYHEQAGTKKIAKLHGDLGTLRCMKCKTVYPCTNYLPPKNLKYCESPNCDGFIRHNVVLFGEMLPKGEFDYAYELLQGVDLFVVLGSSLQVYPANEFPWKAKDRGANVVIINHDPTPMDQYADLVIRGSIGEVLDAVDKEVVKFK